MRTMTLLAVQVASLDDRGTVSIWVVNETPTGDDGGSQVSRQKNGVTSDHARYLRTQYTESRHSLCLGP